MTSLTCVTADPCLSAARLDPLHSLPTVGSLVLSASTQSSIRAWAVKPLYPFPNSAKEATQVSDTQASSHILTSACSALTLFSLK
jgi:hypothetical protein